MELNSDAIMSTDIRYDIGNRLQKKTGEENKFKKLTEFNF